MTQSFDTAKDFGCSVPSSPEAMSIVIEIEITGISIPGLAKVGDNSRKCLNRIEKIVRFDIPMTVPESVMSKYIVSNS